MLLKEAVHERCDKCGSHIRCVEAEHYGCDNCKKEIKNFFDGRERDYLAIAVFYDDRENRPTRHFHFCCWECVFSFLSRIQKTEHACDHFINLPHISFDTGHKNCSYESFIGALKKWREQKASGPKRKRMPTKGR